MLSFEQTSPATIANLTAPFAGLANYRFILDDPTSRTAIVHTFEFTVGSLFGQFMIGFALALLFTLRFPGRTIGRSLIIVPWLLPLIVTGVIFRFLFQLEGGAVNQLLMDIGLVHQPIDWLDDPHLALLTVLIANIWLGVPFFTLLLYSALQDVPVEVKEAALIDGAGAWQRLRLIIVPIILPVIEVTLLLGFVFTVKVFDLVIALTGGGPANATQLITTWSYNLSFQQFSFGEGAALNNVLLVLAMICAPLYLLLSRGSLRRSSGQVEMTRLQRSRPCAGCARSATVVALVMVLFPVYAVIVGLVRVDQHPVQRHVLLAAARRHARQLPHGHPSPIGQRADEPHRRRGDGRARFGRGRAGGLRAVEVPLAGDGRHSQLAARGADSPLHRPGHFAVHHLPLDPPGEHVPGADHRRRHLRHPLCHTRAAGVLLQPAERGDAGARVDGASEWQTFLRIVIPLARSAVITVAVFAFLNGWGDFIFALTDPQRRHHRADHAWDLHVSRQLLDGLGGSDGLGRVRHGAGRSNAGGGAALHREWPHGGFGGGVAVARCHVRGAGGGMPLRESLEGGEWMSQGTANFCLYL